MDLLTSTSPDIAWSDEHPPGGDFILIADKVEAPADFLVQYFVSLYLRGGHRVCLLAASASKHQYATRCRKQGIPFDIHEREGRMRLIDLVAELGAAQAAADAPAVEFSSLDALSAPAASEAALAPPPAPSLDAAIAEMDAAAAADGCTCLIVDDLHLLRAILGPRRAAGLLARARALAATSDRVCVVARAHSDAAPGRADAAAGSAPSPDAAQLSLWRQAADVVIEVDPLATGAARDILGQVSARRRRTPARPCPEDVRLQCAVDAGSGKVRLVRRGEAELGQ